MVAKDEIFDFERMEEMAYMEMAKLRQERERQIIESTDSVIAAQDLYERGFNVFPVEYGTKETHHYWGFLQNARLPEYAIVDIFKMQNIAVLTGKYSQNLFVIDCDDKATFKTLLEKLDQSNLARWVVKSSRGGHIWFLSQDGEIENCILENHVEVWGNKHYMIAPPSLNGETGVIYSWLKRDGYLPPELSKVEIQEIFPGVKVRIAMKNILPTKAYEVLINKNTLNYKTNSEAENAAIFALIRYGWDDESIIELFEDHRPPHFRGKKLSEDWLRKQMIQPARKKLHISPYMDKVINAVSWAIGQPWNSRTGNTDKLVFLACCKRAIFEGPNSFRASKREIAEIANITDNTACNSLHRLTLLKYLEIVKGDSSGNLYEKSSGYHYKLKPEIQEYTSNITVRAFNGVMSLTLERHDIWHPKALGKSAYFVYEYLLKEKKNKSLEEIISGTSKSEGVIKRALSKLENTGLVKQENESWQAIFREIDYLNEKAFDFDVLGTGKKREEQRQREREKQAWKLFRKSLTPVSQN